MSCVRIMSLSCLAALLSAVACDPEVDEHDLELAEEIDEERPEAEPEGPAELAVQAPEPEAAYAECPGWANFCFWPGSSYDGTPKWISGGDFAIVNVATDLGFPNGVRSMRKLGGTRRVKVFSAPYFGGSCKVVGPEGGAAYESALPFPVMSAKRMEANSPGC